MKKADRIMAGFVKEFLGCFGEHEKLVEALLVLKESGIGKERRIACAPFEVHCDPDRESPSLFVGKDGKTAAELYYTGSEWEYWCREEEASLAWRLANIAFLWNKFGD